jgi:hypothetical protein
VGGYRPFFAGKGIFGCFQEKCLIIIGIVATGMVIYDRSGDEGL